eukprot:INCI12692.1.p1 GENE.INCI12692.1~~INCI12692.1.p1  ORF type:complete len:330 (-),score=85.11 INCI12692.1:132-1121(-)
MRATSGSAAAAAAAVATALLLFVLLFSDLATAVGVGSRSSRHHRRRAWDETSQEPRASGSAAAIVSASASASASASSVRPGFALKSKTLQPGCGDRPCPVSLPSIVVDPRYAPKGNASMYTAPLVDAEASRDDHQIFNELVKYRRTVDAINSRRDDRVQDSVRTLLSAARNELYQRDALSHQMDVQKVKAEGELRGFALLAQEFEKHDKTAARLVASAASSLRKYSVEAEDPADPSLLADLTRQVQVVQKHRKEGKAPTVASLESIEKDLDDGSATVDDSDNDDNDSDDSGSNAPDDAQPQNAAQGDSDGDDDAQNDESSAKSSDNRQN